MTLNENALQQILFNIEQIGSPNGIAFTLIQKTGEAHDAEELATLLSQEPTICALILKAANSVFFSRGHEISTIKQAVVHLGTENIKKILFSVELFGVFKGQFASDLFSEPDFWRHSFAGAGIASLYATSQGRADPDIAFVAALLRDIGVLAIRQFLPAEFEQILILKKNRALSFGVASKFIIGTTHREVAYLIGLRWNLPRMIIESINETVNPHEANDEIKAIRESIFFADEFLRTHKYCLWDEYFMPGNSLPQDFDYNKIPSEEYFKEAIAMVDSIYGQLWGGL